MLPRCLYVMIKICKHHFLSTGFGNSRVLLFRKVSFSWFIIWASPVYKYWLHFSTVNSSFSLGPLNTWKVSKYRLLSGPNTGKYGPEKTPYLDTFNAIPKMKMIVWWLLWEFNCKWLYLVKMKNGCVTFRKIYFISILIQVSRIYFLFKVDLSCFE